MRAVIYTRASLDRTGEGKSNARQHEEALRLCEYKRWEVVSHEADVSISAYTEKERPAWLRVLAMIEAGEVDVVVAYHLDRLTRNMADLEKLILLCEQHGVSVATATGDIDLTNDTGRMVARILAAVARQEVERKAARQRLAHVQRRAEGRPWQGVKMLGYERDGKVIEKEAAAIREAMTDVLEDRASLAEIGRRWLALGLDSPYRKDKSKPWTARAVKLVLTNPRAAGLVTVSDRATNSWEVLGKGEWEPIVTETEVTLATAKLNAPERDNGSVKTGRKAGNLLTGIMKCWKCGDTVRAGTARGLPTYACNQWHTEVPRYEADELVRSAFASTVALVAPGAILEPRSGQVDPEGIADEIERLRGRSGVLARSFARGVTSEDDFEAASEDIARQIEALEAQVEHAGTQVDWGALRAESVRDFLQRDMKEQRKVLQRLAEVTMYPSGRAGRSASRQVEVQVKARRNGREVVVPAHVPECKEAPTPTKG